MNRHLLFAFVIILLQTFSAQSQCNDTLPANTVIITNDTTLSNVNGTANFLICPGVEVNFTGNMSTLVHYYMEEGSIVNIGTYHYPTFHVQSTAQVNANHSTATPMPSYILNSVAEYGAIFVDTLDQYTVNVDWCSTLVFNYSNLPGGVGCPATPCVEVLPANTIVITSDTTLSNVNGTANYLICPGVEVDFTGNMSSLVHYYMEEGAILNVGNYHYPTLYMQSTAQVNANHSTATPMASYIFNSVAEYGAIFNDTLDQFTGNIEWCTDLIFDYSNLSGGVGCPTMTSAKNILPTLDLKIYPNPTNRFVQIELKDLDNHSIHITNSLGQTILNQKISQEKFNLDILEYGGKGIYFLSILNERNEVVGVQKMMVY